jgi:protein-S-isoprenylcysteine O-methyltransferase Ste14
MCFRDPVPLKIPELIRYLGLFLFACGVSLFILSHLKLGGFREGGELMTGGIYSRIRNPMYLGFILWVIGFPVFTKSMITLGSSVLWIVCFIFWKVLEEKDLEKKYPEFREYKKKTWF